MKKGRRDLRERGITLVALVVTIIVLLILAGVTITMALSGSGILNRATSARDTHVQAEQNEINALSEADSEIDRLAKGVTGGNGGSGSGSGGSGSGETGGNTPAGTKTITDSGVKRTSATDTSVLSTTETVTVKDNKNNEFKVPANFGIAYDSADNVANGIVIEDSNHNQYVWIPVGTAITRANGTTMEAVTLGRYNFDAKWDSSSSSITGTGVATLVQDATAWATPTAMTPTGQTWSTYEYSASDSAGSSYGNTKANNLQNFVEHTNSNGGYYIARYEAGIAGTTDNNTNSPKADWTTTKPLSKAGVGVWNTINQPNAATACQGMYTSVTSDLINSYAWDTAIVFIQKSTGSNDYAKQNRGSNTSLITTGATGDVQCNIYDMAKNVIEWTTESSTYTISGSRYPCVTRGGDCYGDSYFAAIRDHVSTTGSYDSVGFRPLLYL